MTTQPEEKLSKYSSCNCTQIIPLWRVRVFYSINPQVLVVQTLDSAIHRINHYPGDSVIEVRNSYLAPVVRKVDSVIHWISYYQLDSAIGYRNTYPLDSDLSGGYRYPTFEQLVGKVACKREVEPGSIFTFMCDLLYFTLNPGSLHSINPPSPPPPLFPP